MIIAKTKPTPLRKPSTMRPNTLCRVKTVLLSPPQQTAEGSGAYCSCRMMSRTTTAIAISLAAARNPIYRTQKGARGAWLWSMAIPIASATSSPVVQSSALAVSTNSREMVKVTFAYPSGRNSIRAATPRSLASSSSAWSSAAAIICSSGSSFISDTSHEIGGRAMAAIAPASSCLTLLTKYISR